MEQLRAFWDIPPAISPTVDRNPGGWLSWPPTFRTWYEGRYDESIIYRPTLQSWHPVGVAFNRVGRSGQLGYFLVDDRVFYRQHVYRHITNSVGRLSAGQTDTMARDRHYLAVHRDRSAYFDRGRVVGI